MDIKEFKENRIAKLMENDTPVEFKRGAKIVLHIIPFNAFDTTNNYTDINKIENIEPIYSVPGNLTRKNNLQGQVIYQSGSNSICDSYVQIFTNRIIESVDHHYLIGRDGNNIASYSYEEAIIEAVKHYISNLKDNMPIYIVLSLINIKGYSLRVNNDVDIKLHEIKENVITSEIEINNYVVNIEQAMKPAFDRIWIACGGKGSLNYDINGFKWR